MASSTGLQCASIGSVVIRSFVMSDATYALPSPHGRDKQFVRGRNFEEITAYSTPKCLDRQIPFFVHRQDDARVCPDAKLAGEVLKKLLKFMPEGGLEPPRD